MKDAQCWDEQQGCRSLGQREEARALWLALSFERIISAEIGCGLKKKMACSPPSLMGLRCPSRVRQYAHASRWR
jgi:hypothetical protein